jgi:hypothetical protein
VPTVLSPPATLLGSYCNVTQNLTFSSTTVKGSERLFGAPSAGKYGSLVISNQSVNPPTVGLEQAFVLYLDGDLNVSGTCVGTSNGATFNVAVNAQLKLGWNILVGKVTKVSGTVGEILDVSLSSRTTVPARYAWRWYPR